MITEGDITFGLEVSELFAGPVRKGGAVRKIKESLHQQTIDRYRNSYEREAGISLRVQILGTIDDRVMKELVQELLTHDFASWKPGTQFEFRLNTHFKVHVTKAFRGEWFRVDDRVGWVNSDPLPVIQEGVAKKAENLQWYQHFVGHDVRLLLVANRLHASGKLKLVKKEASVDTLGFRAVYFFSYPENVTVFTAGTACG